MSVKFYLDRLTLAILSQQPTRRLWKEPMERDEGKTKERNRESQGSPVLYQKANQSK